MYTITKSIEVSCAHRLEGHFKCQRMHGHNYVISVTVAGDTLDENGMLIDFGDLKKALAHVEDRIDHKYLVSNENIAMDCPYWHAAANDRLTNDYIHLPVETSTAENLAMWVASFVETYLPAHVVIERVLIRETSSSVAEYVPQGSSRVVVRGMKDVVRK